jgi:drug/metabolite transporter (DMT)-like permease
LVLPACWETWYVLLVLNLQARAAVATFAEARYANGLYIFAELSLTVPLANSSAFLFTVLGEWYVERKVIAKQTWLGMGLVLGGIALCVHSKNQSS